MKATFKTYDFNTCKTTCHRGIVDDVESRIYELQTFLVDIYKFEPSDFSIKKTNDSISFYCHRPKRPGCRKDLNFVHIFTFV